MKKKILLIIATVLTFCLVLNFYYYLSYSQISNKFVSNLVNVSATKDNINTEEIIKIINTKDLKSTNTLAKYGFSNKDINYLQSMHNMYYRNIKITIVVASCICLILISCVIHEHKKMQKDIDKLTKYLKKINGGIYDLSVIDNKESQLSILKNEIYTTTVMLKELAGRELEDKRKLKDSLSNISHQLKTPLTSISLMLDNISNPDIDEQIKKDFLLDCHRQIDNLNFLIISMLKLSRFDACVVELVKEDINIKELIVNSLKNLEIMRELKNINIHVKGQSSIKIIGDYKWELEAFSNIIKNAIEYTEENKNIYILFTDNSLYTTIKIIDEGPGLDKDEQKHIFERFYKGPNSSSNNFGIGLSLAKEIINYDGGKIRVESEKNKGTTFIIDFYH